MTHLFRRGAAALVLACLAHPVLAADREPVVAHVSRRGIDLSSAAGRATLAARIRAAADRDCVSAGASIAKSLDERRCRAEMMRDGDAQIAALVANRGVELASNRR